MLKGEVTEVCLNHTTGCAKDAREGSVRIPHEAERSRMDRRGREGVASRMKVGRRGSACAIKPSVRQ